METIAPAANDRGIGCSLHTEHCICNPPLDTPAIVMLIITNSKHLLLACLPLRENWLWWMNSPNPHHTLWCAIVSLTCGFTSTSVLFVTQGQPWSKREEHKMEQIPESTFVSHAGYHSEECEEMLDHAILPHLGYPSPLGLLYSCSIFCPSIIH